MFVHQSMSCIRVLNRYTLLARRFPPNFDFKSKVYSVLKMSASNRTIDSYFSPKSNSGNMKKRNRENSSEDENVTAKRLSTQGNNSILPDENKIGSPPKDTNREDSKVQLSPEQKQMIEEKRQIALEKLQGKSDVSSMGETWRNALQREFKKDYFLKLRKFVQSERKTKTIYPPEKDVFSWTNMCNIQEVKVVIIGQDPYHGPNQAHGLCFSVKIGVEPPPSLKNIYKELKVDVEGFQIPDHGHLVGWAKQGVLLLNAVLTVVAHNANSHQGKGWEYFTDAVIKWINQNSEHVVFLLWGSYAQKKGASIDKKRHCVLKGPHPSPLSAHRGFFGCKHFSKTNEYLESHGRKPIDWNYLPKSL